MLKKFLLINLLLTSFSAFLSSVNAMDDDEKKHPATKKCSVEEITFDNGHYILSKDQLMRAVDTGTLETNHGTFQVSISCTHTDVDCDYNQFNDKVELFGDINRHMATGYKLPNQDFGMFEIHFTKF